MRIQPERQLFYIPPIWVLLCVLRALAPGGLLALVWQRREALARGALAVRVSERQQVVADELPAQTSVRQVVPDGLAAPVSERQQVVPGELPAAASVQREVVTPCGLPVLPDAPPLAASDPDGRLAQAGPVWPPELPDGPMFPAGWVGQVRACFPQRGPMAGRQHASPKPEVSRPVPCSRSEVGERLQAMRAACGQPMQTVRGCRTPHGHIEPAPEPEACADRVRRPPPDGWAGH